jgi:hypothetical protein
MSKTVGYILTAALVVFAIAVPIIGPTALAAWGLSAGTVAAIGAALSAAVIVNSLLMPKPGASRNAQETTLQLGEVARRAIFGTSATAGSLIDAFDYGGKYGTDNEVVVFALADHEVDSLVGVYVNDTFVPWKGDGNYAQFDEHHLSMYFRSGTETQTLPSVVTTHGPGWTSADNGAGICYAVVDYLSDSPTAKHPAWPGGRPTFLWVVKGKKCYDPRLDSTVTGGSGSHRWDDPTTWVWSENPIVCRYNYVRGVYACDRNDQPDMLLVGRGLSATEAPPENVIAPANFCDEAIGVDLKHAFMTGGLSLDGAGFSPDDVRLAIINGTSFQIWYLPTYTLLLSGTASHNLGSAHVAVNYDGSFYTSSGVAGGTFLVSRSGVVTTASTDTISGGIWLVTAGIFGRHTTPSSNMLQLVGSAVVSTGIGFAPNLYADDPSGNSFAIGGKQSGGSYTTGFGIRDIGAATDHLVTTSAGGAAYGVHNGAGAWFILQGTKIYLVDDATYAITAGPVTVSSGGESSFNGALPGDQTIWLGFTEYSTLNLSVLRTVTPSAWSTGTGSSGSPTYDRINDAMLTRGTLESAITVRYLTAHDKLTIGCVIGADERYLDVDEKFAAAVGGFIYQPGGSVEIEPGQAKAPSFSFTDSDLVIGTQVQYNQGILSRADSEWTNTVIPRYVEPAQKWQDHATPVRRVTADVTTDEGPREETLTLQYVTVERQAGVLGEYSRRLGRLWGRGQAVLPPGDYSQIEEGDWGTWQSDRYLGGATKTIRVESFGLDGKFQNSIRFREIAATVYSDAVTDTQGGAATFRLTAPPADTSTPTSGTWTLAATTLDSTGASVPALELTGVLSDDDASAEAVIVEYWLDDGVTDPTIDPDSIPWVMVGTYPPSTTTIDITGLTGLASYYVALTYIVSGVPGDRLILGPETISDLDISGQIPTITAQDEGSTLTTDLTSVNFVGSGVTATNTGGAVVVTVPGSTPSAPGNAYFFPNSAWSTNDVGAFATLANGFITLASFTVDKLYAVFNNATIGNVYSMFIATVDSSDNITGTVATASSRFTTTATGIQLHTFSLSSPVTLNSGTRYIIALVITSGTGTTACRAYGPTSGDGYIGLPQDIAAELSAWSSRVHRSWYTQNSDAPSSGAPTGTNSTGNYALGMRAQL